MSISYEARINKKIDWFYSRLREQRPSAAAICVGQRYHDSLYKEAIASGGAASDEIENAYAAREAYRRYAVEIGVDWNEQHYSANENESVLLLRPPMRHVAACGEYWED